MSNNIQESCQCPQICAGHCFYANTRETLTAQGARFIVCHCGGCFDEPERGSLAEGGPWIPELCVECTESFFQRNHMDYSSGGQWVNCKVGLTVDNYLYGNDEKNAISALRALMKQSVVSSATEPLNAVDDADEADDDADEADDDDAKAEKHCCGYLFNGECFYANTPHTDTAPAARFIVCHCTENDEGVRGCFDTPDPGSPAYGGPWLTSLCESCTQAFFRRRNYTDGSELREQCSVEATSDNYFSAADENKAFAALYAMMDASFEF